jgi:hypothetical protein
MRRTDRAQLRRVLAQLDAGDVLMVTRPANEEFNTKEDLRRRAAVEVCTPPVEDRRLVTIS